MALNIGTVEPGACHVTATSLSVIDGESAAGTIVVLVQLTIKERGCKKDYHGQCQMMLPREQVERIKGNLPFYLGELRFDLKLDWGNVSGLYREPDALVSKIEFEFGTSKFWVEPFPSTD